MLSGPSFIPSLKFYFSEKNLKKKGEGKRNSRKYQRSKESFFSRKSNGTILKNVTYSIFNKHLLHVWYLQSHNARVFANIFVVELFTVRNYKVRYGRSDQQAEFLLFSSSRWYNYNEPTYAHDSRTFLFFFFFFFGSFFPSLRVLSIFLDFLNYLNVC